MFGELVVKFSVHLSADQVDGLSKEICDALVREGLISSSPIPIGAKPRTLVLQIIQSGSLTLDSLWNTVDPI
jgi:hypothetical protein